MGSFYVVAQSLGQVRLFVSPWIAACQASLSFIISWSLLKLMSIESVMPSNHLILCHPLCLLPSVFPSIRVFSNESVLRMQFFCCNHLLQYRCTIDVVLLREACQGGYGKPSGH